MRVSCARAGEYYSHRDATRGVERYVPKRSHWDSAIVKILSFSRSRGESADASPLYVEGLDRAVALLPDTRIDRVIVGTSQEYQTLKRERRVLSLGSDDLLAGAMVQVFPAFVDCNGSGNVEAAAIAKVMQTLQTLLKSRRPDVFHVHGPTESLQIAALRLARRAGVATAITYQVPVSDSASINLALAAGGLADIRLATSERTAVSLRGAIFDHVGLFANERFWDVVSVSKRELQAWRDRLCPTSVPELIVVCPLRGRSSATLSLLSEAGALLAHTIGAARMRRRIHFVLVGAPRLETPEQSRLAQLAALPRSSVAVTPIGHLSIKDIRALLAIAQAAVFPEYQEGSGWGPLEAMLMRCATIVGTSAGGAELLEDAHTALKVPSTDAKPLAVALHRLAVSPALVRALQKAGRLSASEHTLERYASRHLDLYKRAVATSTGRALPHRPPVVRHAPVVSPSFKSWLPQAVLALDLDLTLVRRAFVYEQRPTPFPLLYEQSMSADCELGVKYIVRAGLEDLAAILSLPWRARLLISMSTQEKVNELSQKLVVGTKPLSEWMDACIGRETLDEFARLNGLELHTSCTPGLTNPLAKPVRAKPVPLLFLEHLKDLGGALAANDRRSAERILRHSSCRSGYGLFLDDQPHFTEMSSNVLCHYIAPFIPLDDYRAIRKSDGENAALEFDFLDRLWRRGTHPFGFLRFLLEKRPSWPWLGLQLNLEHQLMEAMHAMNSVQGLGWTLSRPGSRLYRQYLETQEPRQARLMEHRYREHTKVYKAVVDEYLRRDIAAGWQILFLGRDMDYAFQYAAAVAPEFIAGKRLATLPLSRNIARTGSASDVSALIKSVLPKLNRDAAGLMLYDVGYHGRVPSFVRDALALKREGIAVEARLLNACDKAHAGRCLGAAMEFSDWRGIYHVSRNFGISIERCPHLKGAAARLICRDGISEFRHERLPRSEVLLAQRVVTVIRDAVQCEPSTLSRSSDTAASVARKALDMVAREDPQYRRKMRNLVRPLYDFGRTERAQHVEQVVYIGGGADILTPLLCFRGLRDLILVEHRLTPFAPCLDTDAAAACLAQISLRLLRGSLFNARPPRPRELRSSNGMLPPTAQTCALASVPHFWALAQLIPPIARQVIEEASPGDADSSRLVYSCKFEDSRQVRIQYIVGPTATVSRHASILDPRKSCLIYVNSRVVPWKQAVYWARHTGFVLQKRFLWQRPPLSVPCPQELSAIRQTQPRYTVRPRMHTLYFSELPQATR
jgi:hypothetical protein